MYYEGLGRRKRATARVRLHAAHQISRPGHHPQLDDVRRSLLDARRQVEYIAVGHLIKPGDYGYRGRGYKYPLSLGKH